MNEGEDGSAAPAVDDPVARPKHDIPEPTAAGVRPSPQPKPATQTEGATKRRKGKSSAKSAGAEKAAPRRRGRGTRPFPAVPFEEAFAFAKAIYDFGSGQQVRRLSLFDHMQRTPKIGRAHV